MSKSNVCNSPTSLAYQHTRIGNSQITFITPQTDSARQENLLSRQRQARHGSVPRDRRPWTSIEKAIKKLNGLDARRDTLEAAVEAADRAEEIARDLEYEIVSSAPDGEQLADDYEELGGGRCAVM